MSDLEEEVASLKKEVSDLKALLFAEFDAEQIEKLETYRAAYAMPVCEAETVARRVMMHLYRGSVEMARKALDDGWEQHYGDSVVVEGAALLEEPLSRVMGNGELRVINALDGAGIRTVDDLLKSTANDWLGIPCLGPASAGRLHTLQAMLQQRVKNEQCDD